jgi:hypothetical protein
MIARFEALPKMPDVSFGGFSVDQRLLEEVLLRACVEISICELARSSNPPDNARRRR